MYNTSNTARFSIDPSAAQALGFLWRGRWWIVLFTILTTGLGVYYAQERGTIWRAKSVIYVESGAPVVLGPGNFVQGQNVHYANTQAELLRSTPILEAALAREGIGGNPVLHGKQNELGWLKGHLRLDVGEDNGLITVSLDSKYIAEACNVVNAIVDSYREFQIQNTYQTSSQILGRLTDELEKFEADLQAEQNKLLEFLRDNPGVGVFSEASGVAIERFSELNSALTHAELAAIEAEASWNAAKQLAESPDLLRQVPLQPPKGVALALRDNSEILRRLRDLQDRRTQLLTEVTAEHPMLAELERTVADLEQELDDGNAQLASAYASALELQFRIAEKKFGDLSQKLADHERKIIEFDPKLAEYEALQRRVERMRLIAGTLYQRVREININQSLDISSPGSGAAVVYEPASPNGALIASSKATVVAIAIFVGLVLGAGLSWLLSLFDQRLRTPEDVAEQLPLFSTIPRVSVHKDGAIATWKKDPEFAEAMRSLRTAVYFDTRSVKSKAIQITSPEVRDGKSLTTAGLGIAMAMAGQRTLIIDADFRNPSQPSLLGGIPNERGLAEMLGGDSPDLPATTIPTEIDGLHLLPGGKLTDNPTELLGSPRLAKVFRDLAMRFDRILIDSPPLLRIADARIIAAVCDETLIVLRSGKTTWRVANAACSAIVSVGGRLAGSVLNGAPRDVTHTTGSLQPLEPHLATSLDRFSKAT